MTHLDHLHHVRHWPAWINGQPSESGTRAEVRHPGDDSVVGTFVVPDSASVEAALEGAWQARKPAQRTTAAQRAAALMHVSRPLGARLDEVAAPITAENG